MADRLIRWCAGKPQVLWGRKHNGRGSFREKGKGMMSSDLDTVLSEEAAGRAWAPAVQRDHSPLLTQQDVITTTKEPGGEDVEELDTAYLVHYWGHTMGVWRFLKKLTLEFS